ncbi:hypothetical protein ONA22_06445 [Mycoplasmopsis cynos]|nr:hypothetical protein [Mycoplasmopsis cynos]WAM03318.1 hypothetical protein ONA22_06445 [Mycoplasmopsis cynos]
MVLVWRLSLRYLKNKFNREKFEIFNHQIYVLCGDGDLQEGVALKLFN